jgi:hypothetical protein
MMTTMVAAMKAKGLLGMMNTNEPLMDLGPWEIVLHTFRSNRRPGLADINVKMLTARNS